MEEKGNSTKTRASRRRQIQTDRDWSKSKFLPINVIAEELGVSNMFIRSLIQRQELKAYSFDGTMRIAKKDYQAFLEKSVMKFPGRKIKNDSAPTNGVLH